MKRVEVFTDGACSGNPGPGGWGAILRYNGATRELYGGEADTTNNRMELMAAIAALNALKQPVAVDLYTDSNYVKDGIGGWIDGWKRKNWRPRYSNLKPIRSNSLAYCVPYWECGFRSPLKSPVLSHPRARGKPRSHNSGRVPITKRRSPDKRRPAKR